MAEIHRVHDPEGVRRIRVTGGGTRLGPLVQILADALDREVLLSAHPMRQESEPQGSALSPSVPLHSRKDARRDGDQPRPEGRLPPGDAPPSL